MKKYITIAALCLSLLGLPACSNTTTQPNTSDSIQVMTNIFPIYDWTRNIIGDTEGVEVSLLMENGTDLHSFQPSFQDIQKTSDSDLFVYIVGQNDTWAADVAAQKNNPAMVSLDLISYLAEDVSMEEEVEGMTVEEEEEETYDEHVWLSLTRAIKMTRGIADNLSVIDPANTEAYQANAKAYIEKLTTLHEAYQDAVENASYDTVLFADRFPFLYLTKDYNLNYYAAFAGCSQDTNASFDTVIFLANKVDELHLPAVLTIENNAGTLAKTIIDTTNTKTAKVLSLDSMQSTTKSDVEDGKTYLSIMEENLHILKEALD